LEGFQVVGWPGASWAFEKDIVLLEHLSILSISVGIIDHCVWLMGKR
jgi:hypothetical protein